MATADRSEAAWQAWVLRLVADAGGLAYHTRDSRGSEPGFPDLVICVGGRVLFRELKTGRYQTTPAQERWLATLRESGLDADVWRFPGDADRVLVELGLQEPAGARESAAPVPTTSEAAATRHESTSARDAAVSRYRRAALLRALPPEVREAAQHMGLTQLESTAAQCGVEVTR